MNLFAHQFLFPSNLMILPVTFYFNIAPVLFRSQAYRFHNHRQILPYLYCRNPCYHPNRVISLSARTDYVGLRLILQIQKVRKLNEPVKLILNTLFTCQRTTPGPKTERVKLFRCCRATCQAKNGGPGKS